MIIVYIPCNTVKTAKKIGNILVKKRYVACFNIIPKIFSGYHWPPKENKIESAEESVLIVKTLDEKYDQVKKEVEKIHPYSVPCIMSIKVKDINEKYLNWLKGEIK
ncbi:MAG: divalent-cation tolerance protein CutA [Patescibacteria group bacterium]|nr:divalent-cation tolerance protein CutA [Patescibacteria group bacterium]